MYKLNVTDSNKIKNIINELYLKKLSIYEMKISQGYSKHIRNELIIKNLDSYTEHKLSDELFRGIVIESAQGETKDNIIQKVVDYSSGSYSMNQEIANAYSKCGCNNNLYVDYDEYFSIVIQFIDGDYLDVVNLLDRDDMFERHYVREEEYYCFPNIIRIKKIVHYSKSQAVDMTIDKEIKEFIGKKIHIKQSI